MIKEEAIEIATAKRITRKLCVLNDLSWPELLQHEEDVCQPENSWSYRNWIAFLLKLGMNEEQIFDTAQRRLDNAQGTNSRALTS
ncbi:MAG TPA: hypothetical protein PLU47_17965 [Azonexus sp.]|nr:hypothetical protein [Azonexus sp.]